MRNYIKKQLLSIVDILVKANDVVRKFQKYDSSEMDVIVQCQESAIQIGNNIEEIEGEGTYVVKLLEEYCELIYQVSVALSNQQKTNKILRRTTNILTKISDCINYDLHDTEKEIVFFTYKAAMWDSLESVWRAVKEDGNSDCYVIPIPYYDKNADGTLGQMHYEDGEYPEYVHLTSWQQYNVAQRHPDVVFINNPYDAHNFVTSVHPDYYAKELIKYTEMLIYIPYFVCLDDVPRHFCVNAGTIHADKVIVQSEEVRRTYIEEFHKLEIENNCVGKFGKAEEKFLALGSPKFDKVINTKKEDIVVQDDWNKLIYNQDGTQKKVILYNTSIASLLSAKVEYLNKLKCVLKIFEERKDVVLLWRPHPLSEATCLSMRPELLEEYQEIIRQYMQSNYGIYDASSDVNRAMAISDGYYGDMSSLVACYGVIGKPFLIQNVQSLSGEENKSLNFEDCLIENNSMWFAATNYNGLFKYNITSDKTEFMGKFPNEDSSGERLYGSLVKYKDYIVFSPMRAKEIAVYNIVTLEFEKYQLNKTEQKYNEDGKFNPIVVYENYVFICVEECAAIVKLDLDTKEITYYDEWYYNERKNIDFDKDDNPLFGKDICIIENSFYLASCKHNAVFKFDMKMCEGKYIRVGNDEWSYEGICYDGENIWLSPHTNGPIVRWNPGSDNYQKFEDYPMDFQHGQYDFFSCIYAKPYVWLISGQANLSIKVHTDTGSMEMCNWEIVGTNTKKYKHWHFNYFFAKPIENQKLLVLNAYNKLIKCNFEGQIEEERFIIIPEKIAVELGRKKQNYWINKTKTFEIEQNVEWIYSNLEDFIDLLFDKELLKIIEEKQKESYKRITKNLGNAGQQIFNITKQRGASMQNQIVHETIPIEEVVEIIKAYILPSEPVATDKIIRTKEEFFDLYDQMKRAGYEMFEKMIGNLCYRNKDHRMKYKGLCNVCGKPVDFELDYMFADLIATDKAKEPVWRERMVCMGCCLNNRMRYIIGKIKDEYQPGMKIYINENITYAYKALKKYIPDLVGSEYLAEDLISGQVVDGILHEDAMHLSFSDETFDVMVSQDVFEHVADYELAFKEMHRILKKDGKAIFTIPFNTIENEVEKRARIVDGKVEYLMEPLYHGNPLSDKGSLVFNIFSWDLFDKLKECGFSDAYACTYYNVEKGNLGLLPFYIVAEK